MKAKLVLFKILSRVLLLIFYLTYMYMYIKEQKL